MLRSFLIYCLFTFITVFILVSCDFKDKGNLVITPLTDITIDTTGIPLQTNVEQDSLLTIKPVVTREGVGDGAFSYEWRITLGPGADFSKARVIGKEKHLSAILNGLEPSTNYYSIWFRVTDNTTGLMKGIVFRVVVEPPARQGLVVADSEDGQTSDLSFIMDTLFTTNWVEKGTTVPKATLLNYHEFSRVNERKITGVLHSLFAQRLYYNGLLVNFLHGASRNNVFRMRTDAYTMIAEGKDLFYDGSVNLNIDYYFKSNAATGPAWIMNSGKVSNRLTEAATFSGYRKFSVDVPGNYTCNKFLAVNSLLSQVINFYDENLGRFLRFPATLNTKATPLESTADSIPFRANNLPGYKVLGGGIGNDLSESRFVLNKGSYYGIFTLTYAGAPKRLLDISAAPNIANAVSFVFPSNQAVIYYATANKIYSIRIPQGGAPAYTELYTSPDPITMLEMWRRSGTVTGPNNELCLLAITYNGSEGKVTALPISSTELGLGTVNLSRKATFGGFKKISAVAMQE